MSAALLRSEADREGQASRVSAPAAAGQGTTGPTPGLAPRVATRRPMTAKPAEKVQPSQQRLPGRPEPREEGEDGIPVLPGVS